MEIKPITSAYVDELEGRISRAVGSSGQALAGAPQYCPAKLLLKVWGQPRGFLGQSM